jgi:hypothetical protein
MISSVMTEEESEAWEEAERRMDRIGREGNDGIAYSTPEENEERERLSQKQERYQDSKGEDLIDQAARTYSPEEFRGAMRFNIDKYNRRMGKKDDLVKEIEKMRDYCQRWLEVEEGR